MADFINRVTEHFDELTKSHKEVANYFLYNLDKVAVGTLEDLAGLVGVSTTTVIRFARQLGYSGFTELQKDAQDIVLNKDMIPEQPESGSPDQKVSSRLAISFERDIRNIENTMKDLKEEDLDRAVSLMQSADSLYIMSMRMGFSLAYYAFASWGRLRRDIRLLRFTGMEYPEEMVSMKKGDVCVVFAFPRFTSLAIQLLEWMKKRQVKVILVTSATFVAAREYAEIILPCRVRTASYQNSHVAPICLINYFTMALTAENYDEAAELLRDTEERLGPGFYIGN